MKADQFNESAWRTQFNSNIFVTKYIYASSDFEEKTTMFLINENLIFELNGKRRSLFIINSSATVNPQISINEAALFSIGLCPVKNRNMDELYYGYMIDLSSINYISPIQREISNRQDCLIDKYSELIKAREDSNANKIDQSLNDPRYTKDELFERLIDYGYNVFTINNIPTQKKSKQEKRADVFYEWMKKENRNIDDPFKEKRNVIWDKLHELDPLLFHQILDNNNTTISGFFKEVNAKFK